MTSSIAVTGQPIEVLQKYRVKSTLVMNVSDTIVVWLADTTSVREYFGVPLYPGFGISWDADTALWCVTGGDTAVLTITHLNGTIFNGKPS